LKLARITGSVAATIKYSELQGHKLLLADLVDAKGKVLEPAVVLVDSLGAGHGDLVLVSRGSSARIPSDFAGISVDACCVAIVDDVHLG